MEKDGGPTGPEVEALLLKVREVLNAWTGTYAPDMCSSDHVAESRRVISEGGGTLYYIATLLQEVDEVLKAAATGRSPKSPISTGRGM